MKDSDQAYLAWTPPSSHVEGMPLVALIALAHTHTPTYLPGFRRQVGLGWLE